MSKRRKKESDFEPESSGTEGKENNEKEKVYENVTEKAKVVKPGEIRTKKIMLYSVVIAVVFFGAGFLVNFSMTGFSVAAPETGDQFIFISPPGCTNCEQLEPIAKGVADTLDLPFSKTGFGQQMETPGFALIYEDKYMGAGGFDSEYSLNAVVCQMTGNEDVCNRAEELKPVEQPPTPPPTPEFPKRDQPENTDIETFFDSGAEVCYEDGKPVIRMYASSRCGYCAWNKPMYEKVVKEYMDQGKIVAYLWEDGKNILSDEQEIIPPEEEALRQQYGFTGVPAFIFGCKYYRSGASFSRVENGEALEEEELRNVIDDLLGG